MHEREQELVGLLSKQCTNTEDVHKLLKSRLRVRLKGCLNHKATGLSETSKISALLAEG